ncbi:MAG: hypothetical protein IKO27_07225, partial [Ruminococcus sp.]|nr:hypothetical protein [Ruminococcus sp.]
VICLPAFRHITQILLDLRQQTCVEFRQSDENLDIASDAQGLCGIALTMHFYRAYPRSLLQAVYGGISMRMPPDRQQYDLSDVRFRPGVPDMIPSVFAVQYPILYNSNKKNHKICLNI